MSGEGTPPKAVREKLLSAGWSPIVVDEAFAHIASQRSKNAPRPPKYTRPLPAGGGWPIRALLYVLIFLVFAGAGGYWFYYDNFVNSPAKILEKTAYRVNDVQALAYAADVKLELPFSLMAGLVKTQLPPNLAAEEDADVNLRLAVGGSGALDWHDANRPLSRLEASFRAVGWSDQDILSLDYLADDGQSYFRLSNGKGTELDGLGPVAGQWVKYDHGSAADQFEGEWMVDLGDYSGFGQNFGRFLTGLPGSGAVIDLRRIGTGEINGQRVWQIGLTLDGETFRAQLKKAFPDAASKEALNLLTVRNIEVWVGRDDYLPYRLSFVTESSSGGKKIEASATLQFSQYNSPFKVELPKESITLEQALKSINFSPSPEYETKKE